MRQTLLKKSIEILADGDRRSLRDAGRLLYGLLFGQSVLRVAFFLEGLRRGRPLPGRGIGELEDGDPSDTFRFRFPTADCRTRHFDSLSATS